MTAGAEAQTTTAELPTPADEIQAELVAALPMLTAMRGPRRQLQEIEFQAGPVSDLPQEPVLLRAYGNIRQDHPSTGVWRFAQQEHKTVYIWSQEGGNIAFYDRIDREKHLPEGEVEVVRALECARLLGVASQRFEAQSQAETGADTAMPPSEKRHRKLGHFSLG